jgi:hypothetical protein
MTNQEKRERRREAALKGARTRAAKQLLDQSLKRVADLAVNGPDGRMLINRAQEIGREADLWYFAHTHRFPTRPSAWTGDQRHAAGDFLEKFIRPDGLPQPVKTKTKPPRKTRRNDP